MSTNTPFQQNDATDLLLTTTVQKSLGPHIDNDVCDYIVQMLSENPHDEDAREAVEELILGSIEELEGSENGSPGDILKDFVACLELMLRGGDDGDATNNTNKDTKTQQNDKSSTNSTDDGTNTMRLLTKAINLKEHDIQTFASGLVADHTEERTGDDEEVGAVGGGDTTVRQTSSIQHFYANMIDITNEAAVSERKRRKDKQRAVRQEMEEGERKRAIQEAMDILDNIDDNASKPGDKTKNPDDYLDAAEDNSTDVHLKHFDLPNLRGGGPDLLQNASLTLARGRRYGLMGRNGCGKTTFMTFMAQRQIAGAIPKKMTMTLVRQEIIGSEASAVETVLRSDVKREGVTKFIAWCEGELERLEKGGAVVNEEDTATKNEEEEETTTEDTKKPKKNRLQDKKKAKLHFQIDPPRHRKPRNKTCTPHRKTRHRLPTARNNRRRRRGRSRTEGAKGVGGDGVFD